MIIKLKIYNLNDTNLNNPIILEADRNRIHQVITNLISNCVKFIDKEGYIYIGINKIKKGKSENKEEELVIFDIKDNGIGIDKEIMPKLFTKFASKSFQGTGLGLYICKSIIEAHGGKIWAQNNKMKRVQRLVLVYHSNIVNTSSQKMIIQTVLVINQMM